MDFRLLCEDGELTKADIAALTAALEGFVKTDVPLCIELLFVDEEEIRTLNRETRLVDKVTDVLSYPALEDICGKSISKKDHPYEIDEEGNLLLGSIVICAKRAKEQAEEYGHSYRRELHYLVVHGIMHCLGYDHIEESDRVIMREKEEHVLQKLGITRL